jgi:hypothetical protein
MPRPLHWLRKCRAGQTLHKTNEQLLQELRSLLAVKGKLSAKIIDESVGLRTALTFSFRFGDLRHACELIGYDLRKTGRKSDEEMLQHLRSLLSLTWPRQPANRQRCTLG